MKEGVQEIKLFITRSLLVGVIIGLALIYFFQEVAPLLAHEGLALSSLRYQ